jgi:hypothetical protein
MQQVKIDLSDITEDEGSDQDDAIHLVTRPTGKQVRRHLEDRLEEAQEPTAFVLSFENVGIIDYSCADEILAKLTGRMKQGEYEDTFLLLDELDESNEENIDVALEKQDLCLLGRKTGHKNWEVVGKLDPYLDDVLDIIKDKTELTAKELAEELDLEHNTASTRLGNLHNIRLVVRQHGPIEEGGRQFVYQTLSDAVS